MHPLKAWTDEDPAPAADDDRGSAALEFILVGLVLLVPFVYLIVALGIIQGQSLGAASGARHIARVVSTAPDSDSARERADTVLRSIVAEYGLDAEATRLRIICRPADGACPRAGATLTVTVATRVLLPLAPAVFGLDDVTAIPIEASAVQKVSRVGGSP